MGYDNSRAVLIGVKKSGQSDREVQEYLDELAFLTETEA